MKVKSKYQITNTMMASISMMIDRTFDEDKKWWTNAEKFVNDIKNMD